VSDYVPERGEVIWLDLDPQAGHEQAGHRPALVLSPQSYNRKTGLAIVCPLTTKIKNYPFEVTTTIDGRRGAVLADHVKNVDWIARRAERIGVVNADLVARVASIVAALVGAD
jgi:mRNA interferase MazF